jgi:lysophospholipase L1-like esterase
MAKHLRRSAIALYCCALLLVFDFVYTRYLYVAPPPFYTSNADYHHGLLPNVASEFVWGTNRHAYFTNNLAFRDAAVRDVPLKPDIHRVLLIGDSFTEALGMTFEESFAGQLARAGLERPVKIEFLNAGVSSYSPIIYYRKIRHLLARGVEFDEVVVLVDVSDIKDEASAYFCLDEDPRYRALCQDTEAGMVDAGRVRRELERRFAISNKTRLLVQHLIQKLIGPEKALRHPTSGWTIPGFDAGSTYAPLGIEGGIVRAVGNMQALADLLASHRIPLTVAVYPWPMQLQSDDRNSRQITIWRDFCAKNCKAFIDLFPAFFAEKDAHADWYKRLYIPGDVHFSIAGSQVMFRELARHLLADPPPGRGITATE